jgi:hypothetical protein
MKKGEESKPQRPANPNPNIHFRITPAEYRHLQGVAKAMDRSVAWLIADIVRKWIEARSGASNET